MSKQIKLSQEALQAIALWLLLNGYTEPNSMVSRQALARCMNELGMVIGSPRRIFRNIKRTQTPDSFPMPETSRWALIAIFANEFNPDWFSIAKHWTERNHDALIASGAIA